MLREGALNHRKYANRGAGEDMYGNPFEHRPIFRFSDITKYLMISANNYRYLQIIRDIHKELVISRNEL